MIEGLLVFASQSLKSADNERVVDGTVGQKVSERLRRKRRTMRTRGGGGLLEDETVTDGLNWLVATT
jgi:hypothetical protein